MLSRRGFIQIGAASVGSLALKPFGLLPALAQSGPDYRALVCVFLFGGNDSNNSVIPMDDASFKAYTSIRGNLALSTSNLTGVVNSVSGAPYAFHNRLAEVQSLFASKELAVVANVGSLVQPLTRAQYQAQQTPLPLNLFSHSDQQLQWQSSIAQGNSPTGWAGRAADYIAAQGLNSSKFPVFYSGFNNSAESNARWTALNNLLTTDNGVSLVQAANGVLSNSISDANLLATALTNPPKLTTVFPQTSMGQQLQQVAEIISVRAKLGMSRQIFFCSLGGFDTHTGEIIAHNNLYPELSPALAAFYQATQELSVADNVTTFTESDFSRTFQPTSADGSDHGWGSHHFVLGGAVKGGQIYGKFPTFELGGPDDTDTRGRWIPTTSIDQYGATLCSWFGIPDSALPQVFPNFPNFNSQKLAFV
jgi:uncharacterized protein (DUF1501 family)